MISPQPHKKDKEPRKPQQGRTHTNAKFYTSSAWRGLRKQYLLKLTDRQTDIAKQLTPDKMLYILDKIPVCETCLRLYMADAYTTVVTGMELDHIKPINPDNALLYDNGYSSEDSRRADIYGKPLDEDNLQFLCTRHHAKKSQRERTKQPKT